MPNRKSETKIPKVILPALFFGFKFLDKDLEVSKDEIKICKNLNKEKFLHPNLFSIEELSSLLNFYKNTSEGGLNPLLIVTTNTPSGNYNKHRKKTGETYVKLHFLGVEESIAESIIIKATESILKENGNKQICLRINNIGGKTAQNTFQKEATAYYRKNIDLLSTNSRQLFKKSLFDLYTKSFNSTQEIHENAPEPMDFLGEETREQFSEMLEFIEYLNIPYEINCNLLGDPNYSSHTIFEVSDLKTEKVLAGGTRYNLLAKKIGFKKDISGISVLINVKDGKTVSAKNLEKFSKPKFYLIQVGKKAKIKSLKLIDDLQKENIFVRHLIYRDKLSTQLASSKKTSAPYHIIIGHKESIDNTAIIKDCNGKWQKTLKLAELPDFLKSLK